MALPAHVKYVVIGAGIHGLSSAWHLAENLRKTGKGSGADVLIIDKTSIAAGASGIACGVVRNNYFQPAMRRLMAHSVGVWESDPEAFSYHSVGYMQISPEIMHSDVASIYAQQKEIGYTSSFIEGEKDCMTYMKGIFDDWQAKGITSVLHEKKGGYANNTAAMYGLAKKAEAEGVTEGTGDAEGVAPRLRLAVGVGDDEAVGVGDCVTLRRSGCADVDGRDVSEMVGEGEIEAEVVGEGEGVIEAEVVVEGEAVSVVEAEAPRDKDGVGDGVRVPVGGAPKDGDGDGDASGAKIVKRLL